jgi:outer membrane protein assembly factor BamB
MKIKFFLIVFFFITSSCSSFKNKELKKDKIELVHLWAIDAFSGRKNMGKYTTEFSSPIIKDENVLIGSTSRDIMIIDKYSGRIKRTIPKSIGADAPLLYEDGVLYFGDVFGKVKAYSYRKASYLWTKDVGFPVRSTPCIENGILIMLSSNDVLIGIDAYTGKTIWNIKKDFPIGRTVIKGGASPVCLNSKVYAGFSDGSFLLANIYDGTIEKEKDLSSDTKFIDVDASPYVLKDKIYVSSYDGRLYSLNKKSFNVNWSLKDGSHKKVTIDDNKIYYSSNEGFIYKINKDDGKVIWRLKLDDEIGTKVSVIGNYLVLGSSKDGLIIINSKKGKIEKRFRIGTGVFSDPVVEDKRIYFLTNLGVFHAFRFNLI